MHSLLIGCGGDFGQRLEHELKNQGHTVWQITSDSSPDPCALTVDWSTVDMDSLHRWLRSLPPLDLVFFNQNGASLNTPSFQPEAYQPLALWQQVKQWRQTHWTSCELPFFTVHTLGAALQAHTRVVWMLSESIYKYNQRYQHADYVANKFQNLLIMKNFAQHHPGVFFAVEPGEIDQRPQAKIQTLIDLVGQSGTEGQIFNLDTGRAYDQ